MIKISTVLGVNVNIVETVIQPRFSYLDLNVAEKTTYYVSSYKGQVFQITARPSEHSQYAEDFRFTLEHPRGNTNEVVYFIYSQESSGHSFFSTTLDLYRYTDFPMDMVVLNSAQDLQHETRKIYLFDRQKYGVMLSLDDYRNVGCCRRDIIFSFYAFNVTEPGER